MSVAIIQGASGGLGRGLAAHVLRNTSLKVYALTHQSSSTDLQRHLEAEGKDAKDRLSVMSSIDLTQEDGLERAAKAIQDREGKASVRLIACLAGIVSPPKPRASMIDELKLRSAVPREIIICLRFRRRT